MISVAEGAMFCHWSPRKHHADTFAPTTAEKRQKLLSF